MEDYSPPPTSAAAAGHKTTLNSPPPPAQPLLRRAAPSSSSTSLPPAAITSGDIKSQINAMKKRIDKLLSKTATRLNVMLVRVEAMIEDTEDDGSINPSLDELDAIINEMVLLKLDLYSIISELEFIDNELNHCLVLCDST